MEKAINNEIISQTPKKRGRPAKTTEKRRKKYPLVMFDETFAELNKLAAKEQLSSGIRTSANQIINKIVEGYISKIKEEEKSKDVQS